MSLLQQGNADRRFDIPLSEIGSGLIQEFHQHWLRLSQGGRLPNRADIEPENFKSALPNIILVDIERDPFRVRYRLCGTRVVEICGNLAGRYLDEFGDAKLWNPAPYIEIYRTAAHQRRPVFIHDWIAGEFDVRHYFQAGRWPLANDGQTVDMCIGVEDYLNLRPSDLRPTATPPASSL